MTLVPAERPTHSYGALKSYYTAWPLACIIPDLPPALFHPRASRLPFHPPTQAPSGRSLFLLGQALFPRDMPCRPWDRRLFGGIDAFPSLRQFQLLSQIKNTDVVQREEPRHEGEPKNLSWEYVPFPFKLWEQRHGYFVRRG